LNLEMDQFRLRVATIHTGAAPRVLFPSAAPGGRARPTLRRGDGGQFVTELQQRLGMPDGPAVFGPKTEAAVRAFQRERNMVPDGIVGPKTWAAIDASRVA
jgi:peptidoglycan hydrolase-like protein with peptidoglycan-binding domain